MKGVGYLYYNEMKNKPEKEDGLKLNHGSSAR